MKRVWGILLSASIIGGCGGAPPPPPPLEAPVKAEVDALWARGSALKEALNRADLEFLENRNAAAERAVTDDKTRVQAALLDLLRQGGSEYARRATRTLFDSVEKRLVGLGPKDARRLTVARCAGDANLRLAFQDACANAPEDSAVAAQASSSTPSPLSEPPASASSIPPELEEAEAKCKADLEKCREGCKTAPGNLACLIVAVAYWRGDPEFVTKQDRSAGFALLQETCKAGIRPACRYLRSLHEEAGACTVPDECKDMCDAKLAEACEQIGSAYINGEGVPANAANGHSYRVKACDYGDGQACTQLGIAYTKGWGTARNLTKAREALARACQLRDDIGCALYERFCLETRSCR